MRDIWKYDLKAGKSKHPRQGACVMSAVSFFTNGTLSDHPPCVCPILGEFCRWINDGFSDEHRQLLKPFIPRLAGSYDAERIAARSEYLCRECNARTYTVFSQQPPRKLGKSLSNRKAVAGGNALDILSIYSSVYGSWIGRNPERRRARDDAAQRIAEDICAILDGALKLGKQGEPDVPRMGAANFSFAQAAAETPRRRSRLPPFDNGRTKNSFWGFDGPDGRP